MATASLSPNSAIQRLAAELTAETNRTPAERIFQDAVEEVLKQKPKRRTELLQKLRFIHDEEEMKRQLEKDMQESNFFGPGASDGMSRKVSKAAEHILHAKPFLDKFMQISESMAI